jgi:alginate O-acetyltransferase complex protein AlgI
MLFNSFEFLIFLPLAFLIYWFGFSSKAGRNLFLLLISYIFYGWWDWRFLSLIAFSSAVDFFSGIKIYENINPERKKLFLFLSLATNLGLLGVLKYFNFFSVSLSEAMLSAGIELNAFTLDVVLPVGISFYTFQTMSYSLDVYKGKLKPSTDPVEFFCYVSFFPQLVAGPIERAVNLLPQFQVNRNFNYHQSVKGLRLIIWGLFKKVVLADNAAIYVNKIFLNYSGVSGAELVIGAVLFAFQIYGDFSGYSDMARGISKLFGFELMTNFRTPYFSRDIAEFWRRWHISLSTWFRDYLYIPLGGSQKSKLSAVRNTFIIFLVSGFWHGANWTFIVWGALNALFFLPLLLSGKNRKHTNNVGENKIFPPLKDILNIFFTFCLTCFAWIFFRAENITHAFSYINGIFTNPFFHFNGVLKYSLLPVVLIWIIIEWFSRKSDFSFMMESFNSAFSRKMMYFFLMVCIGLYGAFNKTEFIYFQF